jgi:tRNA 2-thiouridine synthesizing protein A
LALALTIDARGRECPMPIMLLAEQISSAPRGAMASIVTDGAASIRLAVPAW